MLRVILLAAAVLCPIVAVAAPTVSLSPWKPDASGTGVEFKALATLVETDQVQMQDELADGAFEYSIDASSLNWATECTCYRYYVILVRTRATGEVTRHKFKAIPSGSFEDQFAEVKLTIRDAARAGEVRVALPVASAPTLEAKPLLEVSRSDDGPAPVSLGGETRLRLTVQNNLKRMTVEIPSAIVVRPDAGDLWAEAAVRVAEGGERGEGALLSLKPGARETLTLHVRPQTSSAIEQSLIPIESDKFHTRLHLDIPYTNPLFGNREGAVSAIVPVRFRPSILTLLAALVVGVLLGSLIPLLASKRGSVRTWGRATGTAVVVAIILEMVGIFLVANNSKFVLFSFNLDPWQTLPVLLLGIANGLLGFEAAKRLKFIQEKAD
jgi:hypothetical protein